MRPKPGFVVILPLLAVLVLSIGILLYFLVVKGKVSTSSIPVLSKNEGKVTLKSEYDNPFDKSSQYVNPFNQYKNPFDKLK